MSVFISSALVLAAPEDAPLNHARILWRNLLTTAGLTGTAGLASFPLAAIVNPATYERYKPASLPATINFDAGAAITVDAVGFAAHTLGTNANTITISSSDDDVTYTEQAAFIQGGENTPILSLFEEIEARYWRIVISGGSGIPVIGSIYIGQALAMQRGLYGGHTPITLARISTVRPNVSETGQWLGVRQERKGYKTSFQWQHLKAAWYREHFDPFVASNPKVHPFFIAWRPQSYPAEVGYCIATDDIAPSNMGKRDFMEVGMSVEGFSDR
jgi:hypothetical protein